MYNAAALHTVVIGILVDYYCICIKTLHPAIAKSCFELHKHLEPASSDWPQVSKAPNQS